MTSLVRPRRGRALHASALCAALSAVLVLAAPATAAPRDAACGASSGFFAASLPSPEVVRHARDGALRILAIGSSSTWGAGASDPATHSYPAQLEARLAERPEAPRAEVENAGVSGETADSTLRRLGERLARSDYDLVIWQVGTNDAVTGRDLAGFEAMLDAGIEAAQRDGAEIVLVDQQYFPAIKDPVRYEAFVAAVGRAAEEHGVPLFSRYRLMKAWAAQAPDRLDSMLAGDKFHMSDRGYACLADHLSDDILALGGFTPATTVAGTKPLMASAVTRPAR